MQTLNVIESKDFGIQLSKEVSKIREYLLDTFDCETYKESEKLPAKYKEIYDALSDLMEKCDK